MNITDEQIDKLRDALGSKLLQEIIPDVRHVFNPNNIYIWCSSDDTNIYKLHCIDLRQNIYAFTLLSNSRSYASGSGSAEAQMKKAGKDLLIFDTDKDFITWANSNLK